MKLNVIPALNDELEAQEIHPGGLLVALERYAEAFRHFMDLNHDQYARPVEWLEAKDMEKTIQDFLALMPKICPCDDGFSLEAEDDE
ncbi:hypothetical protein LX87_05189 [Larkinella arboricola]|uniref:Uncharacterized protein n=1 Tax=Larkinella arboricola TaxID=643671 RepID=A0A327WLG2_LARAB|nr:hypothetical protein [Larkinella arboricola]RAJ92221.1 hypothetical protein LX87_05189 [Larkinella arboricola]